MRFYYYIENFNKKQFNTNFFFEVLYQIILQFCSKIITLFKDSLISDHLQKKSIDFKIRCYIISIFYFYEDIFIFNNFFFIFFIFFFKKINFFLTNNNVDLYIYIYYLYIFTILIIISIILIYLYIYYINLFTY